nr:hypothetical protein [Tanacetum cinerariifolium]
MQKKKHEQPTTLPATTIITLVIKTTTTQMQSPSQYPQKGSSQPEGKHIKKDKGKKDMSLKDVKEVSIKSKSDDETTHVPGSMVESSKKKEFKRFNFVTESGEHVYLNKEQISAKKKIKEEAKAKVARREGKGETSIYKQIQERIDYLCTIEVELRIDLDRPLSKQDPLDRLNDLANKKRKHADDIHDFFRANKRLKSSV